MIELTPEDLNPTRARRLEWVEPDGLGGFAMGNACLWPTRRYHSLLTVARRPPTDRRVLLAGLEEQVETERESYRLDSSERGEGASPEGWRHQVGMAVDPFPRFLYAVEDHLVERTVAVPVGQNLVLVRYRLLEGPQPLTLLVGPLLAGRSYHDLIQANPLAHALPEDRGDEFAFRPYPEELPLFVPRSGWSYHHDPSWVEDMVYSCEQARGYPYREDLLRPGHFEAQLTVGGAVVFAFSSTSLGACDPAAMLEAEAARRQEVADQTPAKDRRGRLLAQAAARFGVERPPAGRSILAGYPWFEDWGRDALISLRGGAAGPGFAPATEVLRTFARHLETGLIPNRFGDAPGETTFNAADASLWLVSEAGRIAEKTGAWPHEELWTAAQEVYLRYSRGTRHGICVDPQDGLLRASEAGCQLTWMDAKVDDLIITPRSGKPIELQGLWYDTCRVVASEARSRGELSLAKEATAAADRLREGLARRFWSEGLGWFGDFLDDEGTLDTALRPNQLIPMALRHRPFEAAHARRALAAVEAALVTGYGVRTLDPDHPDYRGRYEGDVVARDHAYHQGTIWPWLLGPYGRACLAYRGSAERTRLLTLIEPLLQYLERDGLGNLPEVFDGDPPHSPGGCPAQAWSAAEVRALYDELHRTDPYDPVEI